MSREEIGRSKEGKDCREKGKEVNKKAKEEEEEEKMGWIYWREEGGAKMREEKRGWKRSKE